MSSSEQKLSEGAKGPLQRKSAPKIFSRRSQEYMWRAFVSAEQQIGWTKNAVLTRIILRKVEDGWQAVVKASRDGEYGVAFVTASSLPALMEVLSLKIDDGELDWKRDKYVR